MRQSEELKTIGDMLAPEKYAGRRYGNRGAWVTER